MNKSNSSQSCLPKVYWYGIRSTFASQHSDTELFGHLKMSLVHVARAMHVRLKYFVVNASKVPHTKIKMMVIRKHFIPPAGLDVHVGETGRQCAGERSGRVQRPRGCVESRIHALRRVAPALREMVGVVVGRPA